MSPVDPASPETPNCDNRPVRGARSCTLCRQMKARCNATEQYPKPCSRCAHLGKSPCMIEPSFRRVNKRAYVSLFLRRLTFCRRIAEIQNELEELKNTVKRSSEPINSRASSEYSDSHPSFLAPEANNRNGTYSPGPSSYGSPYARSDEYRQGSIAGRFDSTVEEDLFMTYVSFPGVRLILDFSLNFIPLSQLLITRFHLPLPTASVLCCITRSSFSPPWQLQIILSPGL
jgi:hypothetical protein